MIAICHFALQKRCAACGEQSCEESHASRSSTRLLCLPGQAPPARPHTTPSAAPPSLSVSLRSGSRPRLQGGGGLFLGALRRPRLLRTPALREAASFPPPPLSPSAPLGSGRAAPRRPHPAPRGAMTPRPPSAWQRRASWTRAAESPACCRNAPSLVAAAARGEAPPPQLGAIKAAPAPAPRF